MSTTFLMKGNAAAERFYGQHSRTPLEIKGSWSMSGPQAVGQGGVPECVAEVFRAFPQLKSIALGAENHGVVWQRIATFRCGHCDGTGDVHSIDGEWRGACSCEAGQPVKP